MKAAPEKLRRVSARYAAFAADEARGASPLYERLALAVAEPPQILAFIASLPADRRQPNLFFAAIRQLCGVPADVDALLAHVRRDGARLRRLLRARTNQTNEPGRCAVLLPLLAQLPQPLALLEVGASAGLCLIPDRYGYDYGARQIEPPSVGAPVLTCRVSGRVPLPAGLPRIVFRLGLDLQPIDLRSDEAVDWLEALVWPDQLERAQRLRAAIAVARTAPPRIVAGDLCSDLAPLLAAAPKEATRVVFHTAVLAYVASRERRERFARAVQQAGAIWISNEAPAVFPAHAAAAPPTSRRGCFLLMRDGIPVAWTLPHGQSIDWFGAP